MASLPDSAASVVQYCNHGDTNKHYDPGIQRLAPSSAQVMNALRAESELDARSNESQLPNICSAQTDKKPHTQLVHRNNQQHWKGKHGGRSQYKARGNQNQKSGGVAGKQSTAKKYQGDNRACWNCHESGHIQRDCTRPMGDKDESESQLPERKHWENKKQTKGQFSKRREVAMLSHQADDTMNAVKKYTLDMTIEWVLDSASDCHVSTNKEILLNLRQDDGPMVFDWEGKASKYAEQIGEVESRVKNETPPHTNVPLTLSKVLFTPTRTTNLLSLDRLEQDGWDLIKLKKQQCAWLKKGDLLLKLVKTRGRYRLTSSAVPVSQVKSLSRDNERVFALWHTRLGHLNYGALQRMIRNNTVHGLVLTGNVSAPMNRCWVCMQSRMQRMSYKKVVTTWSTVPFQKLMSDMCYIGVGTYDGYQHFQLIQDEATRYVWFFLLKAKGEATAVVISHVTWLIAQGHHIQVFSTDQGRELVNRQWKQFLRQNGVEFLWTNAYSPEENGLVELMNGIVMSRACSLLTTVDMPYLLWGEAFTFALEMLNIIPSEALDGETPYTRRFGRRPDLSNLRTWGCLVFVFTQDFEEI